MPSNDREQGTADQPSPYRIQHIVELLFDKTQKQHPLPEHFRTVLVQAAIAYTAAYSAELERPTIAARDMILEQTHEFAPTQRIQAACVAALQGKKVRPEHEPCYVALGERGQKRVLYMVVILHLARELDRAAVQRLRVEYDADMAVVSFDGPQVSKALLMLTQARERWEGFIGPIHIIAEELDSSYELPKAEPAPALQWLEKAQDSSTLAGGLAQRTMRRFFERMLRCEAAVRIDTAAEDIHQMRVATCRLQASLEIVERVFEPKIIRDFRHGLDHIANMLGAVRDLDVFLEGLESYASGEGVCVDLSHLRSATMTAREIALINLRYMLENSRYLRFRRDFARFLTVPGMHLVDLPELEHPPRVRDIAGSALWKRYEQLRAFEDGIAIGDREILHRARIAGKGLYYTLEFYGAILGSDAEDLLKELSALQVQLGFVQDLASARAYIKVLEMQYDPGAQQYLSYLKERSAELLVPIPQLWEQATGVSFRNKLYGLIIAL